MFETLNLYCERTSPDFWAEPVNALTNLLFFIAAWFAWRRANSLNAGSPGITLLLLLICAIGTGSFLFHSFATGWAKLLDDLPILLFQLSYLWLYCRQVIGFRSGSIVLMIVVYFVVAIIARQFPALLNGSLIYAPALIVLLMLGSYHRISRQQEPYGLLISAALFVIALSFRTIDNRICADFPLGSHFMWHVCNAGVLYLLMRALLANRPVQPASKRAAAG